MENIWIGGAEGGVGCEAVDKDSVWVEAVKEDLEVVETVAEDDEKDCLG